MADRLTTKGQSLGSKLPYFQRLIEGEFEGTELVAYRCLRTGCGKTFYVAADMDLESATAPCPHCFRVSRVADAYTTKGQPVEITGKPVG